MESTNLWYFGQTRAAGLIDLYSFSLIAPSSLILRYGIEYKHDLIDNIHCLTLLRKELFFSHLWVHPFSLRPTECSQNQISPKKNKTDSRWFLYDSVGLQMKREVMKTAWWCCYKCSLCPSNVQKKAYKFECPEHKANFLSTQQAALNCKRKAAVFSILVVATSGGARRLPRGDGGNIRQDAGGALEVKHGVGVHQYVADPTVLVLILLGEYLCCPHVHPSPAKNLNQGKPDQTSPICPHKMIFWPIICHLSGENFSSSILLTYLEFTFFFLHLLCSRTISVCL